MDLIRDAEADWAAGSEHIAGSNNWVLQGALHVPTQWTGTLSGADPGFVDIATGNLHLIDGTSAVDAANPSPTGIAGYLFPNPLVLPLMQPPLGRVDAVGAAESRADDGFPDIGAYEFGTVAGDAPPDDGQGSGDDGGGASDSSSDSLSGGSGGCWIDLLLRGSSKHER